MSGGSALSSIFGLFTAVSASKIIFPMAEIVMPGLVPTRFAHLFGVSSRAVRRVGKGALAPCPPSDNWWARGACHRARIRATRWLCPPYATFPSWPGHRLAEATPSFGRLCPAMTKKRSQSVRKRGFANTSRFFGQPCRPATLPDTPMDHTKKRRAVSQLLPVATLTSHRGVQCGRSVERRKGMAEPVHRSFKVFPTQERDRHNDDEANGTDWLLRPKRSPR